MSTTKATIARKQRVTASKGGKIVGVFNSVKECSLSLGVPPSRVSEYAKSGRVFKGGYEFKYYG